MGYTAATVRGIAARAGVSFALVRIHFGSKLGLRAAVDLEISARFNSYLEQLQERADSPVEFQNWGLARGAQLLCDELVSYRYISREAIGGGRGGGSLLARYLEIQEHICATMVSAGVLNRGYDPVWAPLIGMFVALGPVFAEPFVTRVIGRPIQNPRVALTFKLEWGKILAHAGARVVSPRQADEPRNADRTNAPGAKSATAVRRVARTGKERLLSAAVQLFAKRGYAGTSLRDVGNLAKVSFALVRFHFGSKADLRQAADQWVIAELEAALAIGLDKSNGRAVPAAYDVAARILAARPELYRYLRRAIVDGTAAGDTLLRRYLDLQRRICREFASVGALPRDYDRIWTPLIAMFVALGPIVLEDFVTRRLGYPALGPRAAFEFKTAARDLMTRPATAAPRSGVAKTRRRLR